MMQMTYGDLCFKSRRIPRPLSKIKTWVYFTLHLTNQWVWSKYPDPGFIQKIATIFQGLFKDHIRFSRTTY